MKKYENLTPVFTTGFAPCLGSEGEIMSELSTISAGNTFTVVAVGQMDVMLVNDLGFHVLIHPQIFMKFFREIKSGVMLNHRSG